MSRSLVELDGVFVSVHAPQGERERRGQTRQSTSSSFPGREIGPVPSTYTPAGSFMLKGI